ncbi:hypothetical protein Tco_1253078 [Tanacetum coccineum]
MPITKVGNTVLSLQSPKLLKDVQRLNGKLASLNRFLAKLAEKSLPFFKTLKKCTKKSDFLWTEEAEVAFRQMKEHIAKLPMLIAPKNKRNHQLPGIIQGSMSDPDLSRKTKEEGHDDTAKRRRTQLPHGGPFASRTVQLCVDRWGAGVIRTDPEGRMRYEKIGVPNLLSKCILKLSKPSKWDLHRYKRDRPDPILKDKVKHWPKTCPSVLIKQVPRSKEQKRCTKENRHPLSFAHLSQTVLEEVIERKNPVNKRGARRFRGKGIPG